MQVTAQLAPHSTDYLVAVTRLPSPNAYLARLEVVGKPIYKRLQTPAELLRWPTLPELQPAGDAGVRCRSEPYTLNPTP